MQYPKISVIVPIYGVEKFIRRCAESLLSQTLEGVEYIFVNDATKDNSIKVLHEVIETYKNRSLDIKIINHPINRGLPAARNTGLRVATGEYIYHCDSDDFLESNALELYYNAAITKNADFVWSDYYISYGSKEIYKKQPDCSSISDVLDATLSGKMKYNVWNKLVRRTVYVQNEILFPEGYSMGEDMTMIKLMSCSGNVAYVNEALYHYVQLNSSSMMQNCFSDNHIRALKHNCEDVVAYLKKKYADDYNVSIYSFALLIKWPFLTTSDRSLYEVWSSWIPEANEYIWKDAGVSKRIKFVEWLASKKMFTLVQLHYWVVIRFYYSIRYRNRK